MIVELVAIQQVPPAGLAPETLLTMLGVAFISLIGGLAGAFIGGQLNRQAVQDKAQWDQLLAQNRATLERELAEDRVAREREMELIREGLGEKLEGVRAELRALGDENHIRFRPTTPARSKP
jgi:hypothetical protein